MPGKNNSGGGNTGGGLSASKLRIGGGAAVAVLGIILAANGFSPDFSVAVIGIGAGIALNAPQIILNVIKWFLKNRTQDDKQDSEKKEDDDADGEGDKGASGKTGDDPGTDETASPPLKKQED